MDTTMLFSFLTSHWKITIYLNLQRLFGTVSSMAIRLDLSSPTHACLSSVCFVAHRDSDSPHLHYRSPCSCEVLRLQKPPVQLPGSSLKESTRQETKPSRSGTSLSAGQCPQWIFRCSCIIVQGEMVLCCGAFVPRTCDLPLNAHSCQ